MCALHAQCCIYKLRVANSLLVSAGRCVCVECSEVVNLLVSHRKRFIFTKTVKTAGTSIESYFERWCMPEGEWKPVHVRGEYVSDAGIIGERSGNPRGAKWYNHMSCKCIYDQVGCDIWNRYFKFTVVRNPFDKVISGFFSCPIIPPEDSGPRVARLCLRMR